MYLFAHVFLDLACQVARACGLASRTRITTSITPGRMAPRTPTATLTAVSAGGGSESLVSTWTTQEHGNYVDAQTRRLALFARLALPRKVQGIILEAVASNCFRELFIFKIFWVLCKMHQLNCSDSIDV